MNDEELANWYDRIYNAIEYHVAGETAVDVIREIFAAGVASRTETTDTADAYEIVEGFVDALTPAVTNRTHAYNLWNLIASDKGRIRSALEWAYHKFAPVGPVVQVEADNKSERKGEH